MSAATIEGEPYKDFVFEMDAYITISIPAHNLDEARSDLAFLTLKAVAKCGDADFGARVLRIAWADDPHDAQPLAHFDARLSGERNGAGE